MSEFFYEHYICTYSKKPVVQCRGTVLQVFCLLEIKVYQALKSVYHVFGVEIERW